MKYRFVTFIALFLFLNFILPSLVNAAPPGVSGTYCDDPSHAVQPQIVEPGQIIKFLSSGHNRVADFTNGGIVDAPDNAQTHDKRGQVVNFANDQLALERIHSVNEDEKNVDYYAADSKCGLYQWSHGWECTETGIVTVCQCLHTVQFQVCSKGGNLIPTKVPTSTPVPTPTKVYPTQPIIIPTKIILTKTPIPRRQVSQEMTFPTIGAFSEKTKQVDTSNPISFHISQLISQFFSFITQPISNQLKTTTTKNQQSIDFLSRFIQEARF